MPSLLDYTLPCPEVICVYALCHLQSLYIFYRAQQISVTLKFDRIKSDHFGIRSHIFKFWFQDLFIV